VITKPSYEYNDQQVIAFKSGRYCPKNGDTDPFSDAELGLGPLLGITRDLGFVWYGQLLRLCLRRLNRQMLFYKDCQTEEGLTAAFLGSGIQDAYFENDAKIKRGVLREYLLTTHLTSLRFLVLQ